MVTLHFVGGRVEQCMKYQLKYLRLGLKNNYAWQIFVYFKCRFHNEGLLRQFSYFLDFFCSGSKLYAHKISRLSDQPFMFFAIFLVILWKISPKIIFVTKFSQFCIIYKKIQKNWTTIGRIVIFYFL